MGNGRPAIRTSRTSPTLGVFLSWSTMHPECLLPRCVTTYSAMYFIRINPRRVGTVESTLVQYQGITDVINFVDGKFFFHSRASDRQQTLHTNGIERSVSIYPVGK